MVNFIQKYKIFFVLLLALVILALGFVFTTKGAKETEALTTTWTITLKAYWSNTAAMDTQTGSYKSKDGNYFHASVGTAYFQITDAASGELNDTDGKISCGTYVGTTASIKWSRYFSVFTGASDVKYKGWIEPLNGFRMVPDDSLSESIEGTQTFNWGNSGGNYTNEIPCYFCPAKYNIKFDANGGYVETNVLANAEDENLDYQLKTQDAQPRIPAILPDIKPLYQIVQEQVYWENFTFPEHPVLRAGYGFNGYYTARTGGTKITESTCFSNTSWTTLYAQWTANTYTATWKANGGSSDQTTTCTYDSNYVLPSTNPTRDGYKFLGWNTKADGTGTAITSSTKYTTVGNTTMYAQWENIRFSISFDRQGGSGGYTSIDVDVGKAVGSSGVPSRTGYTFGGYYTSTNGGGTKFFNDDGTVVTSISSYTDSSGKWLYYGDLTLYAKWTANTYTVTIDTGGGTVTDYKGWTSGTSITKNITYDSAYGELPTLDKTGYSFAYYVYGSTIITSTTTMTTAQVHTLTAIWIEHTYNIAFDANGGSGAMDTLTGVLYTESKTLSTNTFTRANYIFKSWNTSADGTGTQYLNEATVSYLSSTDGATVTMYAQWEETWSNKGSAPSGSGTASSPYLIATAQNLAWLSNQTVTNTTAVGGYYKQTANINLSGTKWNPIGNTSCNFIGEYDGNGYVITNLDILSVKNASGEYMYLYQGLFGYINNATIKNVNVLSGNIYGNDAIGGIVGQSTASTIIGCQSSVAIDSKHCGGIVGVATNTTIENCYSKANITGTDVVGGILGWSNSATVKSCGFGGTLAKTNSKILVGGGTVTISDCFGVVSTSNSFVSTSGATVTNSLYISNGTKKYYGSNSTFTNWVISTTQTPLPKGLSWLGNGGTKVTSLSQITALGYTLA